MEIYFILRVIIKYYLTLLLRLFQLWPPGALSIALCPLTYFSHCEMVVVPLSTFLFSDTRFSRLILASPALVLESIISPRVVLKPRSGH